MRICIINYRKAASVFKNKLVLYGKKSCDTTARCVLYDLGFALIKFYIISTEWIYAVTFNEETIEHEV